MSASALRTLVTHDESTRCAVVSTPPALANLVHASEPASSEPPSPLVEEAVRAWLRGAADSCAFHPLRHGRRELLLFKAPPPKLPVAPSRGRASDVDDS